MSSDLNTEQLKVDLWQNACLNFCMLFCKILKDKPQGFNNESGLFQDGLNICGKKRSNFKVQTWIFEEEICLCHFNSFSSSAGAGGFKSRLFLGEKIADPFRNFQIDPVSNTLRARFRAVFADIFLDFYPHPVVYSCGLLL